MLQFVVAVSCSVRCSVLQCVAVCCSVLQFVAVYCLWVWKASDSEIWRSMVQCVVARFVSSVLQCVAVCCSVLQFVAVYQYGAVCCCQIS